MTWMILSGSMIEAEDDHEIIIDFFNSIDSEQKGVITFEQLKSWLEQYRSHEEIINELLEYFDLGSCLKERISPDDFLQAVMGLTRVRGERVIFAKSLGLPGYLARLLAKGNLFDGLEGLKSLRGIALNQHLDTVCSQFCAILKRLLKTQIEKLFQSQTCNDESEAVKANEKFAQMSGAVTGSFATLDDFVKGPEELLGQPNPNLMVAMEREHCKRKSAESLIVTPNYFVCTASEWEWYWALDPDSAHLPVKLQNRLDANNGLYPGEVGDSLHEVEVQMKIMVSHGYERENLVASIARNFRSEILARKDLLKNEEQRARCASMNVDAISLSSGDILVSVCLPLNWLDADQSLIRDQVRRVCASVSAVDESRITVLVYREKIWTYCRFAERKEFINALKSAPASELYPVLDEYLSSVENDKSSCECTDLLLMTMEARKLLSIANQAQEKQNQYKSDESAALGESLHTAVTKAVTKEFAERGGRHEKKLIEQILAVLTGKHLHGKNKTDFVGKGAYVKAQ